MNYLQTEKLRMYMALRVLLESNPAILEKLPNATELMAGLNKAIADIQNNSVLQQKTGNDLKEQYSRLRKNVVLVMLDASRKMQAYADLKNDNALLKDTKFVESKLARLKDLDLVKMAKTLYGIVNVHLSQLAAFDIKADTQTAFLNDITTFETFVPQMEKTELDQKNVTFTLSENYKTADKIIGSLDKLVEILHTTEVRFYADYKALRKIETHVDVVQLVAKITDATTGAGIPNATATFTQTDGAAAPIVKQSAYKGGFQIKSIPNGIYTVTVEKIGYLTQTLTLTLPGDEPYYMEVRMVKG